MANTVMNTETGTTRTDIDTPFPLRGATALVTGANRGTGRALAGELLERGAAKVYGGARRPDTITDPDIEPVRIDITDPDQIAAAAARCQDVTLLVNNAGVFRGAPLLSTPSAQDARDEMETNYFGTLSMIRAFAPVLAANGGGAVVNVLSVLSFINYAPWGSYSATKSAAWSLNNSVRDELAGQHTRVVAVHAGLVDTEMADGITLPKIPVSDFVSATVDGLEAGRIEVLVDEHTRAFKPLLADHPHNRSSQPRPESVAR
ncbi:SDR family oxidoreductase [Streptomyces sp. 150FB]|uniref:SDR family oxidoreductase n=1 Tax=Streptomyces sp. 150FB TaxID=1576605 RepID=UPI00191C3E94|nr:SDR family oxidoreductase [Streptomyces sp. 150FB]